MTIEFTSTGRVIEVPSAFDQIRTKDQYLTVCYEMMQCRRKLSNLEDFCNNVTRRLLNLKVNGRVEGKVAENLFLIGEQMRGYWHLEKRPGGSVYVPALNFTRNHLPEVSGRWPSPRLYAPAELLADLTWLEFMDAIEASGDQDKLCHILYRPRRMFSKQRVKYKRWRTRKPVTLSQEVKDGIQIWFEATLNYLSQEDMNIGGVWVNFHKLFTRGSGKGIGMIGVLYDIAESGVFGSADQVAERNVYDVLLRLHQLKQRDNDTGK